MFEGGKNGTRDTDAKKRTSSVLVIGDHFDFACPGPVPVHGI